MASFTIHKSKDGRDCSFKNGLAAGKVNKVTEKKFLPGKRQTIFFNNAPRIIAGASVVSEKESKGPLGRFFDLIEHDPKMGEKCFETAEIKMLELSVNKAVEKAGLRNKDIDLMLSGDLLNQITSSSYAARDLGIPYLGVYSACSTMTQALALGASFISAGHYSNIICCTASHFATAERQFRYPLEYGSQRPPYAQWTVTGAGCSVLSDSGDGPSITSATFGKVVDFGTTDLSNMGAAMAPAAADTLLSLFKDTETSVEDYDLILTGDLGKLGSDIMRDLMREQGVELGQIYKDCGAMMYDITQKCYQGGSGAGCSASVFNSYILNKINEGVYKKIVFLATGALMSTQSCYQGESIPCISHAVVIEN